MQEYLDFAINHWELFAALIVTIIMLVWNIYGPSIQGFTPITPDQAVALMNHKNAKVLDVREDKELAQTGTISNALHVRLANVSTLSAADLGGDPTVPVIALCKTGNRSAFACSKLKKLGFEEVYNPKGGILAWLKAGLPVTDKY